MPTILNELLGDNITEEPIQKTKMQLTLESDYIDTAHRFTSVEDCKHEQYDHEAVLFLDNSSYELLLNYNVNLNDLLSKCKDVRHKETKKVPTSVIQHITNRMSAMGLYQNTFPSESKSTCLNNFHEHIPKEKRFFVDTYLNGKVIITDDLNKDTIIKILGTTEFPLNSGIFSMLIPIIIKQR